jgi:hypothetical protein
MPENWSFRMKVVGGREEGRGNEGGDLGKAWESGWGNVKS